MTSNYQVAKYPPCAHCGATHDDVLQGAPFLHTDDPICCEVELTECSFCGESYEDHRTASDNSAPFCMSRHSRPGDRFVRGRQ